MVPKEGHVGQFPANFCVKLVGTNGLYSLISILILQIKINCIIIFSKADTG